MDLAISNETKYDLSKYENLYEKYYLKTLEVLKLTDHFIVSVTFVDIKTIHEINKNYRKIDRPTDVISFAFMDDPNEKNINSKFPIDLGEMYICYDVADKNRLEYGNSIERELCFLFVHGLLHLFGYDHIKKEDEDIMFNYQKLIMEDKD